MNREVVIRNGEDALLGVVKSDLLLLLQHSPGPEHETRKAPGECDRKGGMGTAVLGSQRENPKGQRRQRLVSNPDMSMVVAEPTKLGVEQACTGDWGAGGKK
jgi:hypothetical protein